MFSLAQESFLLGRIFCSYIWFKGSLIRVSPIVNFGYLADFSIFNLLDSAAFTSRSKFENVCSFQMDWDFFFLMPSDKEFYFIHAHNILLGLRSWHDAISNDAPFDNDGRTFWRYSMQSENSHIRFYRKE